jgi:hypothetical protein
LRGDDCVYRGIFNASRSLTPRSSIALIHF